MKRNEIFKYILNPDNMKDLRITKCRSSKTLLAMQHLEKQNVNDPKEEDFLKYFEEKYTK